MLWFYQLNGTAKLQDLNTTKFGRLLDKLDLLCYCFISWTVCSRRVAANSSPSQGEDRRFESGREYWSKRRSVKAALWWGAQAGQSGRPGG